MKKPKLVRPTPEENTAINAGIAADPDTYELTDAEFHELRPLRRGKQKTPTKELISIRLSPEVLNRFRASGDGWQGRVDAALREWLKRHPPRKGA